MNKVTLYGKDSAGGLKLWEVFTVCNAVHVRHGKLGGKIQEKVTYSRGKNAGKANATTDEQQAVLEAEAKATKQMKKGYFLTKEEALSFVDKTPMKAQNFNEYAHKIKYPCFVQPKLNGLRIMIDADGNAQSKQGEVYEIPQHWKQDIEILKSVGLLKNGLDGEVFAGYQSQGGLSLQETVSAFRKPNENTHKLKFYVYDSTEVDADQFDRLCCTVEQIHNFHVKNVVVVHTEIVGTPEEADYFYEYWLKQGAEGMVYRNFAALYQFGKRSYDLIKRKPRQDSEALILSVREDKNGDGVLTCQLENGVKFDCLMRKDSDADINYRKYQNALLLVDKFIKFEFEEFSLDGVPTKPVGVGLREVNPNTWEPVE